MLDVAIIGAGAAGLGAAKAAISKGLSFKVLEAALASALEVDACSLGHPSSAHGAWLSGGVAIERIASAR